MRVTVDGFDIEGTPEEIAALLRAHKGGDSGKATLSADGEDDGSVIDDRFASERIAFRALSRRPLSAAQRALFRALMGAYPGWTSATKLQTITEYSPNQLGGLLGAIGRRLSETEGYVKDSSFFEGLWDADTHQYSYRLPPSVYNAVQRIDP